MTEAAAWVNWSTRQGASSEEAAAFDRWMSASEAHQAAFADLAAMWRSDAMGEAARLAASRKRTRRRSWLVLAPIAALASAMVVIGIVGPWADHRMIETARGERRDVMLADGSRVTLSGSARLLVDQNLLRRSVVLEQGEAFFDVPHDGRPFSVGVGDGVVQVMGTAFNVDRSEGGRTEVDLYRGAVRINTRTGTSMALVPGERGVLEHGRARKAAFTPSAPDWMGGWFDTSDATLSQLVEEMDRFSQTPIVVADERARRIRISGRFRVAEPSSVLDLIQTAYGVQVERRTDRILIKSKAG
ncbi:FecR domain-containing protein [Brevundimonas sp. PAMC22021]|uniref:FecR family protein n=1 Tax=Brevundimonas sp. PAMC22021 TaxID=2861285 RepID=UPI001C6337EF|nr:FecR domain-containing protein [Brevundimonas sp. PAMC22021]QYF85646.1 FecR domain-containing protein [Brevundimonas sp. PAMC22021]